MAANTEEQELKDRLSLIETMIAEGRCSTRNCGWIFLLWGVAYYIAMAWSSLAHYGLAWPITMVGSFMLMGIICWRRRGNRPKTTISRALWSTWIAVAISMFVTLDAIGFSSRADWRIFAAIAATLIGTANAASSLTLRWKLQFVCAVVWWTVAVVSCLGSEGQSVIAFLAANFLCQIAFGIYLMIGEAHQKERNAVHA